MPGDRLRLDSADPIEARRRYREGLAAPTAGWARKFTQAYLVTLPQDWAYDMLLFAQRNPQPVPLLDVTEAGERATALAPDADLATDLPRYRVWRDGQLVDEPTDVAGLWRDDLVSFLIGCSFSFEASLAESEIPLRHRRAGPQRVDVRDEPAVSASRATLGPVGWSQCGRSLRPSCRPRCR